MENFFLNIDYETYWTVFLFGLLISTTAMSTGIDGAAFWGPVLFLVYRVPPQVAIACAIGIEVFGFGSGVYGYAKRKKIKYRQALFLLIFAIPAGIFGAVVSKYIPSTILTIMMLLGCFTLIYTNIYRANRSIEERKPNDLSLQNKPLGAFLSAIGGFFTGTIGIGLGETNDYYLYLKNKYPVPYSSGTTVFMIAITAFLCSVFNFFYYKVTMSQNDIYMIISILFFAIPAVMIGARIGVILSHIFKRKHFNYFISSIFSIMAIIYMYKLNIEHDFLGLIYTSIMSII